MAVYDLNWRRKSGIRKGPVGIGYYKSSKPAVPVIKFEDLGKPEIPFPEEKIARLPEGLPKPVAESARKRRIRPEPVKPRKERKVVRKAVKPAIAVEKAAEKPKKIGLFRRLVEWLKSILRKVFILSRIKKITR